MRLNSKKMVIHLQINIKNEIKKKPKKGSNYLKETLKYRRGNKVLIKWFKMKT